MGSGNGGKSSADFDEGINMKQAFRLVHAEARRRAIQAIQDAPEGYLVRVQPPTRSVDQNCAQWPYLEGFSQQLEWPVNGVMCRLSPEEFKHILTAAFEKETQPRLAAGFDGGIVMLGQRTSKYSKGIFSEWMEFLIAAAAIKGVTPVYKSGQGHEPEAHAIPQ